MEVAPASIPFSTSSLTATASDSTTCPEQIRWTDDRSIALISDIAYGGRRPWGGGGGAVGRWQKRCRNATVGRLF